MDEDPSYKAMVSQHDSRAIPGTANRRIFRAALTVGMFTAVVKAASMCKELGIAGRFGRGDAVDAFLAAYLLPSFAVMLIAGSLSAALIPTYVQVRERQGEAEAQKLFSGTLLATFGLTLVFLVVLASVGPWLLPALAHGFSSGKMHLALELFYAMLPLVWFGAVSTHCGAILNASQCFWAPAIAPLATPLLTLFLVICEADRLGAWTLAGGVILGGIIEALFLAAMLARHGVKLRLHWHGATPAVRQVCFQFVPLFFGALLTSAVSVVDQSMAAWLPAGSLAALAYGNRIVNVIGGLTVASLSAAILPYFSQMAAGGRWRECQHVLRTYTRLLMAVMTPLCIVLVVFSQPIMRLLYERGAFSPQDTQVVARVQSMYALQIPFYAAGLLYVRLLTALRRNDLVMISAGINLALDLVLNLICIRFLGVAGIALATSLFYVGSLSFAAYTASRLLRQGLSSAATAPPGYSASETVCA